MFEGSGPIMDRKRKELTRIFCEEGLGVTCDTNLKSVKFLDVLFDLESDTFRPYHKQKSKVIYVSTGSNHLKIVIDNIPVGINKRLSTISSNEAVFNSEIPIYQEALNKAGFSYKLGYNNNIQKKKIFGNHARLIQDNETRKQSRKNKLIFNPPYNMYCASNVSRIF